MRETVSSFLPRRPGRNNRGGQDLPQEGSRTRAIYDKLAAGGWIGFDEYPRDEVRRVIQYLRNIYGFEIETLQDRHMWSMRAKYRLVG